MALDFTVTPAAERALYGLHDERGADYVRVWAGQACGCGRIGYRMALEEGPAQEDTLIEAGPVKLVVSPDSLPHLTGGTLDYSNEPLQSGFLINNPNAQGGCSCGGHH